MDIKSSYKIHPLTLLIASAVLTVSVYWTGMHGAFFFDDEPNILSVEKIRIQDLSFESLHQAFSSGIASRLGRPVSQLSFALNYYFSGFNPFVFKLTNLVIHCLNGLWIYLIVIRLLNATRQKDSAENTKLLAALTAMAWLLHPIQLTSVLYVVQRMTSLSAFFLLAALFLHIYVREQKQHGHKTLFFLISWLVLWPLSILSKESGLLFFGYILAYELIIRRSFHQSFDLFAKILLGVSSAIAVCFIIYLLTPSGSQWLLSSYGTRTFTLPERLLTEARVIWNYIGLIALPRLGAFGLHHDDIIISTGLLKPWTTLPALMGIAGLILLAWRERNRQPLCAFGITWFLVAHSIESTAVGLEIAHEHRNYLGLLGILLLPIVVLRKLDKHSPLRKAWIIFLLILFVYSVLVTALRSHQFGNEIRRTQTESQYHPLSSRSNYEAAVELVANISAGNPSSKLAGMAQKHYKLAIKLNPINKLGYLGLIHLHCLTDQKIEPEWIDQLAFRLKETQFAIGDSTLLYSLKEMMIARTLCLESADVHRLFNSSLANTTVYANVRALIYSWFADYLILYEKDIPAAKQALSKALGILPANTSNQLKWAQLLFLDGRKEDALVKLKSLNQAELSATEKKTFAILLTCAQEMTSNCTGI